MTDAESSARTLQVLSAVRGGDPYKLEEALINPRTGEVEWDWPTSYGTALHMAAFFGQTALVRMLLQRGASVNAVNPQGDTPLHKAAHTARADVVAVLAREPAIDLTAENLEGLTPLDVAQSKEAVKAIEDAQSAAAEELGKQLLDASNSGDVNRVLELLKHPSFKLVNVNLRDQMTGNSLLHFAAQMGNKEILIRVLQQGADLTLQNLNKQTPHQLASNETAKQILKNHKAQDMMPAGLQQGTKISGPLEKWMNYASGWKKKWFTVENGMLFFFNSSKEVSEASRGSIRLQGAVIMAKKSDPRVFMVKGKNSATYHLRASNEEDRKKWLIALSAASRLKSSKSEIFKTLQETPQESTSDLNLARLLLRDQNEDREPSYNEPPDVSLDALKWQKQAMEKLFKSVSSDMRDNEALAKYSETFASSSTAMLELVTSLVSTAEERVSFWKKKHDHEKRIRTNIEESLRNLANERNEMERRATEYFAEQESHQLKKPQPTAEPEKPEAKEEHDEFYDAEDTEHHRPSKANQVARRRTLPAPMLDRNEVSLWSVIKEFVGKDLSKIAVPVYFNEPLSLLQKFSEDLEYASLLTHTTKAKSSLERMLWVAAFAVSPYSSTVRIAKPFNPILGETYEMNRLEDLGFRSIAEQVSHHPPISACHCEAPDYVYWAEAHIKNRFLGNTLEVIPHGVFHVVLKQTQEHFSWTRVRSSANNLIVGSIWLDNYGIMQITNHKTGDTCQLNFKQKGWWGKGYGDVEGTVCGPDGKPVYKLSGSWLEKLQFASASDPNAEWTTLWKGHGPVPGSEKYYNFSNFAFELNELLEGEREVISPTDSRLRPDQRALEEGRIDFAVQEKLRLEQKQREARKRREEAGETWSPRWFEKAYDPDSKAEYWRYRGGYWEARDSGSFTDVEDIF